MALDLNFGVNLSNIMEGVFSSLDEGAGNLGILPPQWLKVITDSSKNRLAGENSELIKIGTINVVEDENKNTGFAGFGKLKKLFKAAEDQYQNTLVAFYLTVDGSPYYMILWEAGMFGRNKKFRLYYNTGQLEQKKDVNTRWIRATRRTPGRMQKWESTRDGMTYDELMYTIREGNFDVYVILRDEERVMTKIAREKNQAGENKELDLTKMRAKVKFIQKKLGDRVDIFKGDIDKEMKNILNIVETYIQNSLGGKMDKNGDESKRMNESLAKIKSSFDGIQNSLYYVGRVMSDTSAAYSSRNYKGGTAEFSYAMQNFLDSLEKTPS